MATAAYRFRGSAATAMKGGPVYGSFLAPIALRGCGYHVIEAANASDKLIMELMCNRLKTRRECGVSSSTLPEPGSRVRHSCSTGTSTRQPVEVRRNRP
jgi:hypothetical protein